EPVLTAPLFEHAQVVDRVVAGVRLQPDQPVAFLLAEPLPLVNELVPAEIVDELLLRRSAQPDSRVIAISGRAVDVDVGEPEAVLPLFGEKVEEDLEVSRTIQK